MTAPRFKSLSTTPAKHARMLLLSGLCTAAVTGHAAVVTVQPSAIIAEAPRQMFGLNVWAGVDGDVALQPAYRQNLAYMNPGFVRVHAGEMLSPGADRSWISGQAWNASEVNRSIGAIRATLPDVPIMINVPGFPAWMDTNGDGRLDAGRTQDYANFVADLVRIVNTDGGHGVQWFEVFNEDEGRYASNMSAYSAIHNATAAAIKTQDPSVKVAAGAWTQPYAAGLTSFVTNLHADAVDAVTYHQYATGNGTLPIPDLYNRTSDLVGGSAFARQRVDEAGRSDLPVFLGEMNQYWSFDLDTRGTQRGIESAIFDALTFKALAQAGHVDGVMAWNERDGSYGKTSSSNQLRPSAHLFALAGTFLHGHLVSATSDEPQNVDIVAVDSGHALALLLINRSETSQSVDLSLDLPVSAWKVLDVHDLAGDGLTTTTGLASLPDSLMLEASSLRLLTLHYTNPDVPGDYDASGSVEQGDLDLVLANWGRVGGDRPAGWVTDPPVGAVDQGELDRVLSHWGNAAAPQAASAALPEPATAVATLLAVTTIRRRCATEATRRINSLR